MDGFISYWVDGINSVGVDLGLPPIFGWLVLIIPPILYLLFLSFRPYTKPYTEINAEEIETYGSSYKCSNCKHHTYLEIPRGTNVKDFIKDKKCRWCDFELGSKTDDLDKMSVGRAFGLEVDTFVSEDKPVEEIKKDVKEETKDFESDTDFD